MAGACSGFAGGCIQQTFVSVEILGREEWPDTLLGPETTGPLLPSFVGWETPLRWGWWGLLLPHRFWWWGVVFDLWIVVASI